MSLPPNPDKTPIKPRQKFDLPSICLRIDYETDTGQIRDDSESILDNTWVD